MVRLECRPSHEYKGRLMSTKWLLWGHNKVYSTGMCQMREQLENERKEKWITYWKGWKGWKGCRKKILWITRRIIAINSHLDNKHTISHTTTSLLAVEYHTLSHTNKMRAQHISLQINDSRDASLDKIKLKNLCKQRIHEIIAKTKKLVSIKLIHLLLMFSLFLEISIWKLLKAIGGWKTKEIF